VGARVVSLLVACVIFVCYIDESAAQIEVTNNPPTICPPEIVDSIKRGARAVANDLQFLCISIVRSSARWAFSWGLVGCLVGSLLPIIGNICLGIAGACFGLAWGFMDGFIGWIDYISQTRLGIKIFPEEAPHEEAVPEKPEGTEKTPTIIIITS